MKQIDWAQLFKNLVGAEQVLLPIFVHNPRSQQIAGAILVGEEVFGSIFGLIPAVSAPATQETKTAAGVGQTVHNLIHDISHINPEVGLPDVLKLAK